jgi:hypothetical protein
LGGKIARVCLSENREENRGENREESACGALLRALREKFYRAAPCCARCARNFDKSKKMIGTSVTNFRFFEQEFFFRGHVESGQFPLHKF